MKATSVGATRCAMACAAACTVFSATGAEAESAAPPAGGQAPSVMPATGAPAQSVTLYGIIDLGPRYVDNQGVGSIKGLSSGGVRTSRFGMRGSQDLDGGWTTDFKLEAVMMPDTGTSGSASIVGQLWSRDAYVELGHKDYGTVRLGYDLNPSYVTWFENDPWLNIGMGSSGNLFDTTQNGPLRTAFGGISKLDSTAIYTRNMMQYFTPSLGGFFGVVGVAAREGNTTANGSAKNTVVRLGYKNDAFLGAVSRGITDALPAGGVLTRLTDTGAEAAYDFGPVKLAAVWREFKVTANKEEHFVLAATVPTSQGHVIASYGLVNMSGVATTNLAPGTKAGSIAGNDAKMLAIGYTHFLSKKTWLYTTAVRIDNRGGSFLSIPGGPAVSATNFAGRASSGLDVGIAEFF